MLYFFHMSLQITTISKPLFSRVRLSWTPFSLTCTLSRGMEYSMSNRAMVVVGSARVLATMVGTQWTQEYSTISFHSSELTASNSLMIMCMIEILRICSKVVFSM